ncbi:MAG: hypothetical protein GQ553_01560 [Nitrosomonadaceae bacterium]|nr:hypothetical protein [Nitrosomonadaceae bacterium]
MTEPTVAQFDGDVVKYYAAMAKFAKYVKKELEMYKKIMDEEVFPLTEFLSEHPTYNLAAWGGSSPLVAIKLLKFLEEKLVLANAIINPACEILPDTYEKEIQAYLNHKPNDKG